MRYPDINKDNPYYYIYWKDLRRSFLSLFLLGTFRTNNEDYKQFIDWLEGKYRTSDDFYTIDVNNCNIKIPIPSLYDYKCFKAEFLDIIMPLITDDKLPQPFLEGPYEFGDVRIEEGSTVFDIGANFGLFSSLALARGCNVYAFEPTEKVADDYLLKLGGVYPNLRIIKKAVSNVTGTTTFYGFDGNSSCNSITNTKGDYTFSVPTVSIDDFVNDMKVPMVDFIKIDAEGAERLILDGGRKTLREFGPKLVVCFYHRFDDSIVLRKLIKSANPDYDIVFHNRKIYARIRKK